jgi:hypothetical protein
MKIKAKIETGDKGITPLHNPAPRVSHYVMTLRRKGVAIDTDKQAHGGAFPGEHGAYRLKSAVTIEQVEGRT